MKKVVTAGLLVAMGSLSWLACGRGKTDEKEGEAKTEVAVHVGKIVHTTLRGYVIAYGEVEPQPPGSQRGASSSVAPAVPGVITRVDVSEGQRVAKGTLLFQLDSRAADVVADKARTAVEFAEKVYERQKKLLATEGTSQKNFQEAEGNLKAARDDLAAAQTQQALLRVTAPLAGTVAHIHVKPGQAVDLSTVLAELVDLDRLVVSAGVPGAELAQLKTGQTVEVVVDKSAPPVTGSLVYIGPDVDPKTGTAVVRAALPAPSDLRPGQFVSLRIVTQQHECLAVPVESLVKNDEGASVISLVHDGRAVQTPVTTGLRDGGLVEVEGKGVTADAAVVTEGAYGLPADTRIRILSQ